MELKRAISDEAYECTEHGDVGALLRRHGLYSSTLSKWRNALASTEGLRGPGRPKMLDAKEKEIRDLRRRIEQLDTRARRAESLVDFQKKRCCCYKRQRRSARTHEGAGRAPGRCVYSRSL